MLPHISQAEALEPPVTTNGQVELLLPDGGESNLFRSIEWSTNLVDWEPVARDYGLDWENTFPHALPLSTSGADQTLVNTGTRAVKRWSLDSSSRTGGAHQRASRKIKPITAA